MHQRTRPPQAGWAPGVSFIAWRRLLAAIEIIPGCCSRCACMKPSHRSLSRLRLSSPCRPHPMTARAALPSASSKPAPLTLLIPMPPCAAAVGSSLLKLTADCRHLQRQALQRSLQRSAPQRSRGMAAFRQISALRQTPPAQMLVCLTTMRLMCTRYWRRTSVLVSPYTVHL